MNKRRVIWEQGAEGEYRRFTIEQGGAEGRVYLESATPHWEEMKDLTGKYTLCFVRAFVGAIVPAMVFGIILAVIVIIILCVI